ncbi:MAG TPA: hypothetical protein VFV86_06960, partial [Nitrososphaeraceae archaeon]|nr:hypothetical protein [Nitrososphaeraceae archaeon]
MPLINEYSEKVYKTLIDRFKKQNRNLEDDTIRYYVGRFHQLLPSIQQRFKNGDETIKGAIPKELLIPNKQNKITQYTDILQWKRFTDLEKIVDIFPASKSFQKQALEKNMAETDADEVYKQDNIEIYKGDSMHSCIKYGNNEYYSWCISRAGETRSMYYSYRFREGNSRMFYFVFDRNRSSHKSRIKEFDDKWHAFVIHVYEKGTYAITTADNPGETDFTRWEEMGRMIPADIWNKIKGMKSLFKYIPPSQEETELQALKNKSLSKEQFNQLSYKTKILYVQNNATTLPSEIFKVLDLDLKNMAINNDRRCSYDELKSNLGLLKRYPDYRFSRHEDEPIPYPFIPYLKEDMQRQYYDKFEADYLTFDEIEKYFSKNIIHEYIDKQISNYDFLPEEAIKYMNEEQKK